MPDKIDIQIIDQRDAVDVSAFVDALSTCLEALHCIESQMARDEGVKFVWRIVNATKNSPLTASLVGDSSDVRVRFSPDDVMENFVTGLSELSEFDDEQVPVRHRWDDRTLSAVSKFQQLSPRGVSINFSGFGRRVSIDRNVVVNARKIIGARALPSARFEDYGTVEGVLSVLSGKGARVQFSLEESLTGQTIPCYFDESLIPKVRPEWRNRVCVSGMVRRAAHDGSITSISVEKLEGIESVEIDWINATPINMTNGVESSEYVRRLRGEE